MLWNEARMPSLMPCHAGDRVMSLESRSIIDKPSSTGAGHSQKQPRRGAEQALFQDFPQDWNTATECLLNFYELLTAVFLLA
jgi:hypothetical protein